jgi:hypothetical protein
MTQIATQRASVLESLSSQHKQARIFVGHFIQRQQWIGSTWIECRQPPQELLPDVGIEVLTRTLAIQVDPEQFVSS